MQSYLKHYINGAWVESEGGRRHEVIDPSTEQPCTEITLGTAADVDKAVAAARAAFPAWSQSSIEERAAILEKIIAGMKARLPELAAATSREMGAPISFAQMAQVPAGLGHFIGTLAALREFSFSETVGSARVVHEPVGVVAMITPWNWPLNQICAKVAPALAAGNTMILKPSEEAPSNAMIFAEILDEAGVPPGVFNLVNGDGPGVGAALSAHKGVDMVSFTGSTRAGVAVATAAAATVKRVHQELGGKAPNLVLEGAKLEEVLPPTLAGVIANTGQSCIAPTRLLVHKSQAEAATEVVKAIMDATVVGNPEDQGAHIGPVVNKAQFEKIQSLIQSALDEGARLVTGGTGRPDGRNAGYFIKPTVLADVTPEMRIYREETFGPVATITTYDDRDQAVEMANDTDYGLSATISGDPAEAAKIAGKLRAGLVTINSWGPTPGTAFGGFKQSGNGREGGKYGLTDFMEIKTIVGEPA
ncbi:MULTISPECIES: aldehyde dehydrogenase family protein [Sphingomonas]|uniref:Aldehyde dehydrogenase family protein n=1 Tax=Sphingomonas lycopersici TaxID=2951807 RepID=A0AA41ZA86_9SPHN|nr:MULTISPECIES: aldehyde dehydrogenase family protein [Sphingomonas]MCW6532067.1 aldehyde dehydrogenase family protein [Sphingomonas lycopersici]MCW6535853.1 aldehyde dehydrogenase family protein [Sphingomonas lycopersici]OJU15321.1 MAG: aldehyde dehydrogenase family protein [Sphingomonas sp. 66-10]